MALFKAIARGFDGKRVVEVGEAFEFEGRPGKWMVEIKSSEPVAEANEETNESATVSKPPAKNQKKKS